MKIKLPQVTLMGIDCVNIERIQKALDISCEGIEFADVKLLTSLPTEDNRKVEIPHIGSIEDFSLFCLRDLVKYVDTDFVLLVQYDGFILNPNSWTDEFLSYDYIGAPWLVADWSVKNFNFPEELLGSKVVGNGGFSLRSKRLLEVSSRLVKENLIIDTHPEDVSLCVWNRDLLEKEGLKIAPIEVAELFSIEGEEWKYDNQFGFHGFSWTNIDKWIAEHPEHLLIKKEYNSARDASV